MTTSKKPPILLFILLLLLLLPLPSIIRISRHPEPYRHSRAGRAGCRRQVPVDYALKRKRIRKPKVCLDTPEPPGPGPLIFLVRSLCRFVLGPQATHTQPCGGTAEGAYASLLQYATLFPRQIPCPNLIKSKVHSVLPASKD